MIKYKIGEIVASTTGRDKEKCYLVYKIEGKNLYLVNGSTKTIKNPKVKNCRHIISLNIIIENLKEKIEANKTVYDAEIFSALKKLKESKGV